MPNASAEQFSTFTLKGGDAGPLVGEAPLMVISFPRSGSSLLRAMFHNHPEIAILSEPYWMMILLKALEREKRPLTRQLASNYLQTHVARHWYEISNITPADVTALLPAGPISKAELISAIGRAYARRFGKERWGVKYPGVDFRLGIPLLHAFFPHATFIYLARDFRDVYLSQLKAELRRDLKDLYLFCFLWVIQIGKILRDFQNIGDRTLIIRYEDLIENPRRVLNEVCRVAGLSNSPEHIESMLSYHANLSPDIPQSALHQNLAKAVLSENRGKFMQQLSPVQIRCTEAIAGDVLRKLGYPPMQDQDRPSLLDYPATALSIARRLGTNAYTTYRKKTTISGILLHPSLARVRWKGPGT